MTSFPPRHHSDQGEMQSHVSRTADCERIQNRARHYVGRILYFVSDVAHIVISKIVIYGDQSSAAQTEDEATIKGHRSWRKIERPVRIEVEKTGDNDRHHRKHRANPKREVHLAQ